MIIVAIAVAWVIYELLTSKKRQKLFRRWAEKDREADRAYDIALALLEAGVSTKNKVFKQARRKFFTLQRESSELWKQYCA